MGGVCARRADKAAPANYVSAARAGGGEEASDDGEQLPPQLTALDADFPEFVAADRSAICFNVRPGDVALTPDPFFHWQGAYFELQADGTPVDATWTDALPSISAPAGLEQVRRFCAEAVQLGDRAFFSPGKAKRWSEGIRGPDGVKPNTSQNVLVRGAAGEWVMHELSVAEPGLVERTPLAGPVLRRIAYMALELEFEDDLPQVPCTYGGGVSEAAWLDGSSLIKVRRSCDRPSDRSVRGHLVAAVPRSFRAVRFVSLAKREVFLQAVSSVPTLPMTGATLCRGSEFGSPLSREIAEGLGEELGLRAEEHGIRLMASASMGGHDSIMSADCDLTTGFMRAPNCQAAHFKGLNAVRLHGDAWLVKNGVSYVVEELVSDWGNHAKEASLMAAAAHPRSAALCANGGPTVATNVVRFLHLSSARQVFTISAMHSGAGCSGAAASFAMTEEALVSAVQSLIDLEPSFFGAKVTATPAAVLATLQAKPLTILEFTGDGPECCNATSFTVAPGTPNKQKSPGLSAEQTSCAGTYAKSAAQHVTEALVQSRDSAL